MCRIWSQSISRSFRGITTANRTTSARLTKEL
ncbi:hypothetical protein CABS03_09842 [Colletotrichum abscissum]|uniref:Uncharacterized protein n=1 Tax=Colletotrichum abscissum TaxID=1671311 RepID=A0A9P9X3L5_9PEZI|nr:hypothetical protein CABS02_13043 [Colletotrichum abscissum]